MKNELQGVVDYCKKFPAIVCYGASEHGFIVKHFLEGRGIKVSAFLITDEVDSCERRDGVPLYSIKDAKTIPNEALILLSLYERHHMSVVNNIKKYLPYLEIMPLSDSIQRQMHQELIVMERDEMLFSSCELIDSEISVYKNRCVELWKKYNCVECRFIDVFRLGAYSMWRYYCYIRRKNINNVYYLYYPVHQEHHPEEKLKGANGYLLGKMKRKGISVVSKDNLKFWMYVFRNYKDRCVMHNEYNFAGWSKDLVANYYDVTTHTDLVDFDENEITSGQEFLKSIGLRKVYVCISNRDLVFLQNAKGDKLIPDFRDIYRNSNIENHQIAIKYLAEHDIQAVRMGAFIEKSLRNENVIEYAGSQYRSEFMDVYLTSQCKFFVGDLSGILALPMLMAKPMVINNVPIITERFDAVGFFAMDRDIAIFKKLWDRKNRRYLTILDMLDFEVNICNQEANRTGAVLSEYQRRDIVPIDNTPEEILAAVKEMNERIDGTVKYDALDIELQKRYREIVDNYPMKDNVLNNWRLGAAFLRENQWLLE